MDTRILFLVRDNLPPFRADVTVLFGKYLTRLGVFSDVLGQYNPDHTGELVWPAGKAIVAGPGHKGITAEFIRPFRDMVALLKHREPFSLVQVRDKIRTGAIASVYAKWHEKPFVYWMSFPYAEEFEVTARNREKPSVAMQLADYVRIKLSRQVLYKWVLPKADHIFVQSEAMRDWLANKGFNPNSITAVPMGVDMERFQRNLITPNNDPRLNGKRVIIHVGQASKARFADFMLDLVVALKATEPNILLVLAGDAPSPEEKQWLREEINQRNIEDHVLLTGWLNQEQVMPYMIRAEVGLSPYPRSEIEDVASPTKLVEYLSLGIPSVGNDIPDQKLVIERSGAGLCVLMEINAFRDAVLKLLHDPAFHLQCSQNGPVFISNERTYASIAQKVANTYQAILADVKKT